MQQRIALGLQEEGRGIDSDDSSPASVPVREETVNFYSGAVRVALREEGTILMLLKPLGENLALELPVGEMALISDAPPLEIAGAVKIVASALDETNTPHAYQRIYDALYRRFNITSYRNLPMSRYDDALA